MPGLATLDARVQLLRVFNLVQAKRAVRHVVTPVEDAVVEVQFFSFSEPHTLAAQMDTAA